MLRKVQDRCIFAQRPQKTLQKTCAASQKSANPILLKKIARGDPYEKIFFEKIKFFYFAKNDFFRLFWGFPGAG